MKQCIACLNGELSSELLECLNTIHLSCTHFTNRNELQLWTQKNNRDNTSLVIFKGERVYLESVILILFPTAYIIWIHEPERNIKEENRIKICSNDDDVLNFFKICLNGFAPKEFKQRVLLNQTNDDTETVKQNVAPNKLQKVEMEEPIKKEPINKQQISKEENEQKSIENDKNDKKEEPPLIPQEEIEENENKYNLRARNIQREVFSKYTRDDHKMIGIWSPLHRIGVSTICFNLALYLGKNRIYTALLEGLTEQHTLKNKLLKYTTVPKGWVSYASAIHTDGIIKETDWSYKNVKFLPLDSNDMNHQWNEDSLESYMTTTKVVDITLVDIPTGKLTDFSRYSLKFLDELWIVVTDDYQDIKTWKDYIHQLQKEHNLKVYLIFNQTYSFSQTEKLAKEIDLPLLTSIPSIHEHIAKNNYENRPIIENIETAQIIEPHFLQLAQHLFGEDYSPLEEHAREDNKLINPKRIFNLLKVLKRS